MTPSDWAIYIGAKAIWWLYPTVHVIGLAMCVWTYRLCRKPGYMIVAVYFLLASGGFLFGPAIHRALADRSHPQSELSTDAEKRYMDELMALNLKYYPSGRVASHNIHFPLGPIILVSGLWVLARRESKKAPNKTLQATAADPASCD